jgi:hypothetical protein
MRILFNVLSEDGTRRIQGVKAVSAIGLHTDLFFSRHLPRTAEGTRKFLLHTKRSFSFLSLPHFIQQNQPQNKKDML